MKKTDPAAAAADESLRTPEQWRAHAFPNGGRDNKRLHPSLWQHSAAAALHGWDAHVHHVGAPMQLSGEDYFAALVSASEPDAKGNYRPHPGALSPHARAGKG